MRSTLRPFWLMYSRAPVDAGDVGRVELTLGRLPAARGDRQRQGCCCRDCCEETASAARSIGVVQVQRGLPIAWQVFLPRCKARAGSSSHCRSGVQPISVPPKSSVGIALEYAQLPTTSVFIHSLKSV